jgi:hypothetical protein
MAPPVAQRAQAALALQAPFEREVTMPAPGEGEADALEVSPAGGDTVPSVVVLLQAAQQVTGPPQVVLGFASVRPVEVQQVHVARVTVTATAGRPAA